MSAKAVVRKNILPRQSASQSAVFSSSQPAVAFSSQPPKPKTKVVGGHVIYDLGNGAFSTMNLISTGGCGYPLNDEEVGVVNNSSQKGSFEDPSSNPPDPGQSLSNKSQ
jgi:hypothetical protein